MRLVSCDTAAAFASAAQPWLACKERENNLILSTLRRAIRSGTEVRGWLAAGPNGPALGLLQAGPHFLQMSDGDLGSARFAAETVVADLPGVVGPDAVADAFAQHWAAKAGQAAKEHSEMTFYTAERLNEVRLPAGSMRAATLDDFEVLAPMAAAAGREMNLPAPETSPENVANRLRHNIAEQQQFVWDDGSGIRAMASYAEGLGGRGARIAWVFTHPEFRGRGFGAAVTAALAQRLLDGGQAWIGLFADNANATSTRIYRRLGFSPQVAYKTWRFE